MKLLFATQNKHKVEELNKLIGANFELLTLADFKFTDELKESSALLEENAIEKARFVFHQFNMNCFSEDSGLEVAHLKGAPGALSARYAGVEKNSDKNISKLLEDMKNAVDRSAQFRTVIALIMEGKEFLFEGIVEGIIRNERKGSNGFGYDPIFQPLEFNRTFAEMTLDEKSEISHRASAFAKMKKHFNELKG